MNEIVHNRILTPSKFLFEKSAIIYSVWTSDSAILFRCNLTAFHCCVSETIPKKTRCGVGHHLDQLMNNKFKEFAFFEDKIKGSMSKKYVCLADINSD